MTTTGAPAPDDSSHNDQVELLRKMARERGIMTDMVGDDELAAMLNSQRPKIKLPGDNRELSQFASEIGAAVRTHHLFRRDRTAVIINEEKQRLDVMSPEMLRTWVEYNLCCYKEKPARDDQRFITIVKTMNLDTARGTLEAMQFWLQLPEIKRINQTRLPVIREDGGIDLLKPGYFAEQGIYTLDDGLALEEEMTLEEAKTFIDDRLKDFPFPNERSKSVAIAAMLTMFCATMLPKRALRPGFIYTANSPGAGKTLLAKMAIIPVAGTCSTRTFPRKEEAKKVLDVIAMDATNYILFDNIRGKIAGEEIEAFITSAEWEGRILGESTKFRVDNVATVFLTGNQSTTSGDMADRCLFVELFVQEADNRDRKIPRIIDDTFLGDPIERSKMCSALWSLVRRWEADGKPKPTTVMPRFEAWSNIVAAIVCNAGYSDPIAKPEIPGGGDVEIHDMRELVSALAPERPDPDSVEAPAPGEPEHSIKAEWKFDAVIDKVKALGLFEETEVKAGRTTEDMFDPSGAITPAGKSLFGKLLSRYDRRLFATADGRRLRFVVEGKGNTRRYTVVLETE
jgi:hypothetical protein